MLRQPASQCTLASDYHTWSIDKVTLNENTKAKNSIEENVSVEDLTEFYKLKNYHESHSLHFVSYFLSVPFDSSQFPLNFLPKNAIFHFSFGVASKKAATKEKMSVNNQTNGNIQLTHFRFNASNWILVALLMQLSVDENEKSFHSKELFKENQISFSLKWINLATNVTRKTAIFLFYCCLFVPPLKSANVET